MNWEKLLCTETFRSPTRPLEDGRHPFNSDHDKIIFSGAFRRLARKTQVHPMATNDHIHNRLTHSLEVACVGRSIGVLIGEHLKDDGSLPNNESPQTLGVIVEATCLAHDIGNPPFGHVGEEVIRSWFEKNKDIHFPSMDPQEYEDLRFFEGNAQGLRTLANIESDINQGGMNLTFATLAASIKYPWLSLDAKENNKPTKHGFYLTEKDLVTKVAKATGMSEIKKDKDILIGYKRHPLAHIMEAADDICYGILDLEDGVEMGIIRLEEVQGIFKDHYNPIEIEGDSRGRKLAKLRGIIIQAAINEVKDAFIKNRKAYEEGCNEPLIDKTKSIGDAIKQAKIMAAEKIFNHFRKVEIEIGSYHVLSNLLDTMIPAALEHSRKKGDTSFQNKRIIDLMGEETFIQNADSVPLSNDYYAARRVIDFIAGMTDNYATHLSKRFSGI